MVLAQVSLQHRAMHWKPNWWLFFCRMLFAGSAMLAPVARANDHPHSTPHSVAYSVPAVGLDFESSERGPITVSTYTIGAAPDVSGNKMCGPQKAVDIPVVKDGWLWLTFSVPVDRRQAYVTWLGAPGESIGEKTNRELFADLWHALARGFEGLAGEGGHPRIVRYIVRMTPEDCTYVERLQFKPSHAVERIDVPVAVHDPGLLGAASTSLIQALFEVAAHETTHVLNMYPYTAERLRWLHRSEAVAPHDPALPTSLDAEIRAVSVERCMRRLILPRPEGFDYLGSLWAEHRMEFDERMRQEPILRIWSRTFEREYQLVGADSMTNGDAATLQLLSQCAMYLRRKQLVDDYPAPNIVEREAAEKTFRSVRQAWRPLHFQGYSYQH